MLNWIISITKEYLEHYKLCANEWKVLSKIICVWWQSYNCVQVKLFVLISNTWNHLTVCEQMRSGSFKKM